MKVPPEMRGGPCVQRGHIARVGVHRFSATPFQISGRQSSGAFVLSAADRSEDGDGGMIADRCTEPVRVAGILVVDEEIDVRSQLALFGEHAIDDSRALCRQGTERVGHGFAGSVDRDNGVAVRVKPEDRRDLKGYRHDPSVWLLPDHCRLHAHNRGQAVRDYAPIVTIVCGAEELAAPGAEIDARRVE